MIRKQHIYVDDATGNVVNELRAEGEPSKLFAIGMHILDINGQKQPDQYRIDIEADNITDAFAKLPEAMAAAQKARLEFVQAQLNAASQRILVPGQQPMKFNDGTPISGTYKGQRRMNGQH